MSGKKAIIAGAGIAGLSAGIALRLAGFEVLVLERAPALVEAGAGVQLSPNGMKALDALGVSSLLEHALFLPPAIEIRHGSSGRRLLSVEMGDAAVRRWGARYAQVHRADLHTALLRRFAELGGTVRTGVGVSGYDSASVLAEGARLDADVIVGADGLHSRIRRQMHGPGAPRFTGTVAWRTTVPVELLGDRAPPPLGIVWTGAGRHAVTTRVRGGAVVNFVGVVESADAADEDWDAAGSRDEARRAFGAWHPSLDTIIERADTLNRWAIFDRPPLPFWSDGPVVLVGDAAHPMQPSAAQGACQALEDAVVLGRTLGAADDMAAACTAFFEARIARTTRVQETSAAQARMFHPRSTLAQVAAFGPMWLGGHLAPRLVARRFDWLYGYDASAG